MAKKKSKRSKKTRRSKNTRRSKKTRRGVKPSVKPANQNPFSLVMYHFVRIPWYIIKSFDWLFTVITAILVYLTK